MTLLLHGGAAVVFVLAARVYFTGFFRSASALGLGYAALAGTTAFRTLPAGAAIAAVVLLLALPLALLAIHAVDARRGLFLVPTIYAIPLAFVGGALLWVVLTLAILLG